MSGRIVYCPDCNENRVIVEGRCISCGLFDYEWYDDEDEEDEDYKAEYYVDAEEEDYEDYEDEDDE